MNTRLQDRLLREVRAAGRVRAADIVRTSAAYADERLHAVQRLIDTGQLRLSWNAHGDSYLEEVAR